MTSGLESQITQALAGLLALAVTAAISYLLPRAKRWLLAHTNAKTASVATTALDGLGKIADAVVRDFDQRIVSDAKKNGVWNAALAQQVKHDAVQAVMSQSGNLSKLASATVGNAQDLVGSLIEAAVAQNKPLPNASAPTTRNSGQAS